MIENDISYKLIPKLMILIAFGFLLTGCKKNKFEPEESFIKVYNDKDLHKNYFPLSMQRTSDKGYLILSAYNGWNIHLLKTNELGEMLWEYNLPSKYVNAVPNLIQRDGSLFFICMDNIGLFTYIMQVDENNKKAKAIQEFQEIQYPMYVYDNKSEVYIQNYNRITYETGIFELNSGLDQIQKSGAVHIYTDVEDKIVDHLNYTGKRFPFFINVTPEKNHIIFSGFNNYSFSTVFMDADLNFSGVYNGAAYDGGLNAILPLGGDKFSLARFSFSNLYYNPNATLDPTTIDIAESIPAEGKAELDPQSPVLIKKVLISDKEYVVYLSSTKSNQLLLNFYIEGSNVLKGSKYLGQSVPLKACDFAKTKDGGLVILTRVTVMGGFNRIATIKLSKEELENVID